MWLDTRLAFLDGDDPATRRTQIDAFEVILLLVLATEYWARAIPHWETLSDPTLARLAAATALCLVGLLRPWRRLAFTGLAVLHVGVIWADFPATGNHAYLECLLCGLCAFLDTSERRQQRLLLRAVRWMVLIIFFASGLQKLVHGYYFQGQFLAHAVWMETFRPILRLLISETELARLLTYTREVGQGPFLVESLPFVLASNGVYLAEMGLAVLLAWRPTRALGVLAAVVFLFAVEAAAREVFFGAITLNATLLFLRSDLNRRMVEPVGMLMIYLLLVRLELLPAVTFH